MTNALRIISSIKLARIIVFAMLLRGTICPVVCQKQSQHSNQSSVKVSNLTAEEFDSWVKVQAEEIGTARQKPLSLRNALLSRLRANKYATDEAIMGVVTAWYFYEENNAYLAQESKGIHGQPFPKDTYNNTIGLINDLLTLSYGRPGLTAKLHTKMAELYDDMAVKTKIVTEYDKAARILIPLHLDVEIQRNMSLNAKADAMYSLGKIKEAEAAYLTVLSDDFTVVEDPKALETLRQCYIHAGGGLINCRRSNLAALKETFFIPSTQEELGPSLQAAIKDAQMRTSR